MQMLVMQITVNLCLSDPPLSVLFPPPPTHTHAHPQTRLWLHWSVVIPLLGDFLMDGEGKNRWKNLAAS